MGAIVSTILSLFGDTVGHGRGRRAFAISVQHDLYMARSSHDASDPNALTGTDAPLDTSSTAAGLPVEQTGPTDTRLAQGKTPDGVKHTRAAALYTGLVVGAIILVVLMVFIIQNLDSVPIHLFGWTFDLPIGIGMLLAAVAGALVMATAGGVRILQVRRAAKRK